MLSPLVHLVSSFSCQCYFQIIVYEIWLRHSASHAQTNLALLVYSNFQLSLDPSLKARFKSHVLTSQLWAIIAN